MKIIALVVLIAYIPSFALGMPVLLIPEEEQEERPDCLSLETYRMPFAYVMFFMNRTAMGLRLRAGPGLISSQKDHLSGENLLARSQTVEVDAGTHL